ncbi:MAG: hypothetical protein WBE71_07825 [Xanthobacteraceae bacterium]
MFLLTFGAVSSVAGAVLAASGLSVHDHTFDGSLVTPGIVAVVGGLLLIGLGFGLRVLQRIELALAARPAAARTARAGETPEPIKASASVAEPPSEPSRTPIPVKITRRPATAPVGAPAPLAPAAEKHVDDLPQKFPSQKFPSQRFPSQRFPSIVRAGPTPASEEIDPAPRPFAPAAVSDEASDVESVDPFAPRALKVRNGASPTPAHMSAHLSAPMSASMSAARVSTRATLDATARAPLTTERPKSPAFDALWPKGPRPRRALAQAAALVEMPEIPAVAPAPVIEEHGVEPPPAVTLEETAEPLTVLKSGVVDGMAYTLYSDGSIEAQLPQGTLRFGSIAELRAHIEQDTRG